MSEASASVFAGALAGLMSTVVTNPLDILRARLAASREATAVSEKRLTAHIRAIMADEGIVRGLLLRGLFTNLASSVPSNSVYLPTYTYMRKLTRGWWGEDSQLATAVSSCTAVAATNTTLSPLFTVRTRVQLDKTNFFEVCASILKHDGPAGFYRGLLTNALGRMVEEGLFWMIFENLKRASESGELQQGNMLWSSCSVAGLSATAKAIGSAVAYPYNVVMTHLREVDKATMQHNHTRILPTVRFIYARDGFSGFYRGLTPHMMRSVISKATQIYVFTYALFLYTTYVQPKPAVHPVA